MCDDKATSVILSPEHPQTSRTLTLDASNTHQPLQYFLSSLVGCSQHALSQAAAEAKVCGLDSRRPTHLTLQDCDERPVQVKLGAVQWRAESQLTQATGSAPEKLSAVTLKAEVLERIPAAQLRALKEKALQNSPLTAALMQSGCKVNIELTPPAWMFKSSMGDHTLRELLQHAA